MAKISDSDRIKQLERQLIEVTEERDNLAENFVRASNKLISLKQQQNELTESTAELVNKKDESRVVDYNGPDFDDVLNKQLDDFTVRDAIATRVYWGRFVTIQLMGSGLIILRQQSHHSVRSQTKTDKYTPTQLSLSLETFFLILESMEYAEKQFGLDRKAIVEKITNGDAIEFTSNIVVF